MHDLNEREKLVLEAIVRNYILTTNPVASTYIARHSHLALSPATIRHIMGSLEEKGYIYQPHPSAGRIPTTMGYRIYVDEMMGRTRLSKQHKEQICQAIRQNPGDLENLLKEATRILAHLSRQLGIIISPHLGEGVFHRMEITQLSSERLLIVISIKSGLVKTIVLELHSSIQPDQLDLLKQILNERLEGLKLKEIRNRFKEIVQDLGEDDTGLIRLFISTAERIFDFSDDNDVYITGTHNILRQPEFLDTQKFSGIVELLEDKKIIIHLLDRSIATQDWNVKIGEEIGEQRMDGCSIIAARYRIGQVNGTLGIIGPTRMDYSHLVPLVNFTAQMLSQPLEND
ncbi:MAG: heat-inducible transcriptional repressor HrcA [Calditrichia bacterium]